MLYSTNSNNLKNLLYELSQERTNNNLSTNNLNYNLSKEVIDFDLNTSLISIIESVGGM